MSTINQEIAEAIMAGDYPEDRPVKLVTYTNLWGGKSWAVVFEGQNPLKYEQAEACANVKTIWTKEEGRV